VGAKRDSIIALGKRVREKYQTGGERRGKNEKKIQNEKYA